ncbi:MAG: TIGR03000 domain-containing protein [Gemmatales bacterium]|nr:TIGR03000 domain-containing protein [Gemmatales bacterium]MDW7993097.1 TIGR03000 domain-containing protein [Gemmatales bacterium]
MYSVVLLTAMATTQVNAPSWFWHHRWFACHGWCSGWCHGWCAGWCSGWCSGWCAGYCHGAYYVPVIPVVYAGHGCYGGPVATCFGCHGCYGTTPPGSYYTPPSRQVETIPAPPREVKPDSKPMEKAEPEKPALAPNRARLIVELPADATLYVDDQPIRSPAKSVRTFVTPSLEPDQTYYYILRAEVVRNGQRYEESRRVIVRANREIRVVFPDPESATVRTVSTQ